MTYQFHISNDLEQSFQSNATAEIAAYLRRPIVVVKFIPTGWAKKTRLFLRSHNFAMTDDGKACNMSKVSEFCLE